MKQFKISKTFNSRQDFIESEELKEIFSPYAATELARYKRVDERFQFIRAYRVDVEPEGNYGRGFKLFKLYKQPYGLRTLKEVSAISIISNQQLRGVIILDNNITLTDEYFEKENDTIKLLIENDVIVM